MDGIKKLQDNDGHWYWMPIKLVEQFEKDKMSLLGRDYMSCPDKFDYFEEDYSKYKTGGDPELTPDFYNNLLSINFRLQKCVVNNIDKLDFIKISESKPSTRRRVIIKNEISIVTGFYDGIEFISYDYDKSKIVYDKAVYWCDLPRYYIVVGKDKQHNKKIFIDNENYASEDEIRSFNKLKKIVKSLDDKQYRGIAGFLNMSPEFISLKRMSEEYKEWLPLDRKEIEFQPTKNPSYDGSKQDLSIADEVCHWNTPDKFDEFGNDYSKYETGGDPDLKPYFFKNKTGLDWVGKEGTEKSTVSFNTLAKIVRQLEKCEYQTKDGLHDMKMNSAFMSLKKISEEEYKAWLPLKLVPDETKYTSQELLEIFNQRGILLADEIKPDLVWRYTANGDIPVPEPNKSYSQVPCLVIRKGNKQSEILYHNDKHQCWDSADIDDWECDFTDVEKWVSLNELENLLNNAE